MFNLLLNKWLGQNCGKKLISNYITLKIKKIILNTKEIKCLHCNNKINGTHL